MLTSNETKIIKFICFEYGVNMVGVMNKKLNPKYVLCRKIIAYVFINLGYKPKKIYEILNITELTFLNYCNKLILDKKIDEVLKYIEDNFVCKNHISFKDFVLNNSNYTHKFIANKFNKSVKQVQNMQAYNNFKNKNKL